MSDAIDANEFLNSTAQYDVPISQKLSLDLDMSSGLIDPSTRGASVFEEVEKNLGNMWDEFYDGQKKPM